MKIKTTYKLGELCFYIFLFLIMIYYAFRKTTLNYEVLTFTLILAIPFVMVKLVLEKYSLKEFICMGVLAVLGGISAVLIGNTSILVSFFIVLGMKNTDYMIALKIVFYIRLVSCIMILIGAFTGLVDNLEFIREEGTGQVRKAMGYAHPNTFGIYCFDIISLWFILYGRKKWKIKLLAALGINVFSFMMTNSRTSFLLNLFYLAMVLLVNLMKDRKKLRLMAKLSFPFCLGINLLMPLILGSDIGQKLDKMLSYRIRLSESFIRVYGISPFGKKIANSVSSAYYWHLDSGYLNLFIQFGFIIGLICLILYYHAGKMEYSNKYIYAAIIGFSFYGIIEDVMSSFLFNYLWIILGAAFYDMLGSPQTNIQKKINGLLEDSL